MGIINGLEDKNYEVATDLRKVVDTRYNYSYVDLEIVMLDPEEYIIPECLPACRALWDKNIETFMVSNNDDDDLYVLFVNVSEENKKILKELQEIDSRYFFSEFRNAFGIRVDGKDSNSMVELEKLTEVFNLQDTFRYQSEESFLVEYKRIGGKLIVHDDGTIHSDINPELENVSLEEALEKTGKKFLYVPEEGRIYTSVMYLDWHQRYRKSIIDNVLELVANITPNKENLNSEIAHLRDTYIFSKIEYVNELLKRKYIRDLIVETNKQSPEFLFKIVQNIMSEIEMGEVSFEEMENIEDELIILLLSIQDKVLVNKLVKLKNK